MNRSLLTVALAGTMAASVPSVAHAQPVKDRAAGKSATTATVYAVVGTALPIAMLGAGFALRNGSDHEKELALGLTLAGGLGLVIGPSAGNVYADGGTAGLAGTAVRLVVFTGVGAVVDLRDEVRHWNQSCLFASDTGCNALDIPEEKTPKLDVAVDTALITGGALVAATVVWDIATAGKHAREFNRVHSIAMTPSLVSTGGTPTVGLGFNGRF